MQIQESPSGAVSLVALPTQPHGVAWPGPRPSDWPTGPIPSGVDASRVNELLDQAFGSNPDPAFGESFATLIVQGGRIVAERYGPGTGPDTPHLSWSMAKSITHALVGILAADGVLDLEASAPVPEWADPTDPRHEITLDQMLRMVDGLNFCESYALPATAAITGDTGPTDAVPVEVPFSHCIDMLFGTGAGDHAGYAASRPLAHTPGSVFNYSSGTANIVARIVCDVVSDEVLAGSQSAARSEAARSWMREHLFDPIGMTSADPSFDAAGNFVGSSYLHATARDYARFGLLYLRGGQWDGRQILPRDWTDYARRPRGVDDDGNAYGSHWWVDEDGRGTFRASGYEWQRVMCVPATDLVIVRLGKTLEVNYDTPATWMKALIAEFDPLRI